MMLWSNAKITRAKADVLMKTDLDHHAVFVLAALLMFAGPVTAPARVWHVDQHHPHAGDDQPGTADAPLKTISQGAARAQPGDTVLVGRGVYREHVAPSRGGSDAKHTITYQGKPGENVFVKGSEVWTPTWHEHDAPASNAVIWRASLDPQLFAESRALYDPVDAPFNPLLAGNGYTSATDARNTVVRPCEDDKPCAPTRGQIFVNGRPLTQVTDAAQLAAQPDAFFVTRDGQNVLVRLNDGENPAGQFIEITVREQIFAPVTRNLAFIRVAGFTMEHAANGQPFPQVGAVSTRSGRQWIIEDNVIRYANTIGLDIGAEGWGALFGGNAPQIWKGTPRENLPGPWSGVGGVIVRRNVITDNGQAGIEAYAAGPRILVEHNLIARNNRLRFAVDSEAGGLKSHGVDNSVFRHNLFIDNDCNGLWLDGNADNNRITGNLFINNKGSGCFIEGCGQGAPDTGAAWNLVDNNVAAYTRSAVGGFYGDGFYVHSGGHTIFCHNLSFANAFYGIRVQFLHENFPTHNHHVFNNIVLANGRGAIHLPPPHDKAVDNYSDYNVVGPTRGGATPMFSGGLGDGPHKAAPIMTLQQWRQRYNWDVNSADIAPLQAQWWVQSRTLTLRLGRMQELAFPGVPPVLMDHPYREPPDSAKAREAWTPHGIDVDFFGQPRPMDRWPTPGPFELPSEQETWTGRLWPVR